MIIHNFSLNPNFFNIYKVCVYIYIYIYFFFFFFFYLAAATAAKSLQSCPTLYDPIDGSPPGSPVPGIL